MAILTWYKRQPPEPLVFRDDEVLPFSGTIVNEHPDWYKQTQSIPWNAVVFQDEDGGGVLARIPIEEVYDFLKDQQTIAWSSVIVAHEEGGGILANFHLEQEEDATQRQQQAIAWLSNPYAIEEEFHLVTSIGVDQEENASNTIQQTVAWLCQPFTYEEFGTSLKNFGLDQEEFYQEQRQHQSWYVHQQVDEGERIDLRGLIDDYVWTDQYQSQPWLSVVTSDEAGGGTFAYIPIEEVHDWNKQVQEQPWTSIAVNDEDGWVPVFIVVFVSGDFPQWTVPPLGYTWTTPPLEYDWTVP